MYYTIEDSMNTYPDLINSGGKELWKVNKMLVWLQLK